MVSERLLNSGKFLIDKKYIIPYEEHIAKYDGKSTKTKLQLLTKEKNLPINLYNKIWQAFCVLLPVKSVGVMGDARSYDKTLVLRAVTSVDGMTADVFQFEHSFLSKISTRIVNEVTGINRVTYDITSKPPGTIEWE